MHKMTHTSSSSTTRWIAAFTTTDVYFANWPRTTASVTACCTYMTSIFRLCLSHARGVVVINSTVGFSALQHGKPVKVMGDALYDLAGMTFQDSLQSFWIASDTQPPCANLFHRFRTFLVHHTQINGSFYRYRIFDWSALRERESMSKPWNEADVGRLLSPQRNPSNASSPAESNSAVVDPLPELLDAS